MTATTAPLTFRRTPAGSWEATAPLSGEADAFRVLIERMGASGWNVHCTTYRRHLSDDRRPNLNDARAWANVVYRTVNV
jgi:hypothetical protein